MTDVTKTIAPKSDQLNADDLIGRDNITITVTKVNMTGSKEQPISINYEGDNGKPYKPNLSMRRVLVQLWGGEGQNYIGRSMTLYRDEKVKFGPNEVGGLKISHLSNIAETVTLALTVSKAQRRPHVVRPLEAAQRVKSASVEGHATQASTEPTEGMEYISVDQQTELDDMLKGNPQLKERLLNVKAQCASLAFMPASKYQAAKDWLIAQVGE